MQAAKNHVSAVLTPQQIEAMLVSQETLATYLASLNPEQISHTMDTLTKNETMDPMVKKALLALFRLALQESRNNEAEIRKILEPKIRDLALCLGLNRQINELEQLNASL